MKVEKRRFLKIISRTFSANFSGFDSQKLFTLSLVFFLMAGAEAYQPKGQQAYANRLKTRKLVRVVTKAAKIGFPVGVT